MPDFLFFSVRLFLSRYGQITASVALHRHIQQQLASVEFAGLATTMSSIHHLMGQPGRLGLGQIQFTLQVDVVIVMVMMMVVISTTTRAGGRIGNGGWTADGPTDGRRRESVQRYPLVVIFLFSFRSFSPLKGWLLVKVLLTSDIIDWVKPSP